MRRAAEITRRGHEAAMRATRPGVFEYEIEAVLEYEYHRGGAQSTAYDSIVAGGDNAMTLHYSTNRERLEAGTLLLVDSACELDLYATDVTRTLTNSTRSSGAACPVRTAWASSKCRRNVASASAERGTSASGIVNS